MLSFSGGRLLALEVIAGTNLPVPSNRTPTGHYVHVSTPYGQRNTTTKQAMVDGSIPWNETVTIHGRPPTFSKWFMSIFSRNSKAVRLEIRASYGSGRQDEVVGKLDTTVEQLLANGEQSMPLSTVDNQCIYLKLKAQLVDHAAGGALTESVVISQPVRAPAVVPSTTRASPSNQAQTQPRARNVLIFGETGSGKSSVINAIAQQSLAETSNDAVGCTPKSQRHPVDIAGQKFVLIDTAGLNEGSEGKVPAAVAKRQLKKLLRELMDSSSPSGGLDLLVYCVRSTAARQALIRDYNTFYSGDQKKVPIVIVVTGLERDMESWWDLNKGKFNGMQFTDYACVTTLQESPENSDSINRRITESSDILRNLVVNNCLDPADGSWSTGSWCRSPSWSED